MSPNSIILSYLMCNTLREHVCFLHQF